MKKKIEWDSELSTISVSLITSLHPRFKSYFISPSSLFRNTNKSGNSNHSYHIRPETYIQHYRFFLLWTVSMNFIHNIWQSSRQLIYLSHILRTFWTTLDGSNQTAYLVCSIIFITLKIFVVAEMNHRLQSHESIACHSFFLIDWHKSSSLNQ